MMHFDLATLYFLAIGTLLLSAALTLWERQARPRRGRELALLATGYVTLAIGCAAAGDRHYWPGVAGSALSNLAIVAGYLLILNGVAALNGRHYRAGSITMLAAMALAWAVVGTRWPDAMWSYVSAVPIAIVSGATAREVLKGSQLRLLRSRRVALAVTSGHALFYVGRAVVLPLLAALYDESIVAIVGKITMYEGVLYSVALPMAVLALIREEAHDELLATSRTDYLTGLGNRQWFFEEGARIIRRAGDERAVSLLAFDLDYFKAINDRYGHAAGDEVLKSFAHIARVMLGSGAVLARIGGEEFAALLPDQDCLRARELGQAVARRFAETSAHGNDVRVKATVSVGLAELGVEGSDLAGLLSIADRALYMAKARGRNRIESAQLTPLAAVA
jgi:diguanylate cyclase (GGDEF)-like protein